jgi:hypothetical protein
MADINGTRASVSLPYHYCMRPPCSDELTARFFDRHGDEVAAAKGFRVKTGGAFSESVRWGPAGLLYPKYLPCTPQPDCYASLWYSQQGRHPVKLVTRSVRAIEWAP